MMNYRARKIAGMILLVAFAIGIMGFVVMWLWNALIPGILGGRNITLLEAFGLLLLAKIFIGFGTGFSGHRKSYRCNCSRGVDPNQLSDEEKERLKAKFMEKCGWTRNRKVE